MQGHVHLHVAGHYGLARETVKQIDCRHLERELGPIDLSGVEVTRWTNSRSRRGIATPPWWSSALRKRVLWVGRGRGREDMRPFFELLGDDGCKRIKAVAMDMSAAYGEEVKAPGQELPMAAAQKPRERHSRGGPGTAG